MRQTKLLAPTGLTYFLIIALLVQFTISSCSSKNENIVKVEFGNPVDNFIELIDSVEIIPLETDSLHILGFKKRLFIENDKYIVVNMDVFNSCLIPQNGSNKNEDISSLDSYYLHSHIYSYDLSGNFIEEIGRRGDGIGEYNDILSAQIYDHNLIVYSTPDKFSDHDKELCYDLQGGVDEKILMEEINGDAYKTKDGVLSYIGFGTNLPYRLTLIEEGGETKNFLFGKENRKVYSVSGLYPNFSSDGDDIFLIDSYNSTIFKYRKKEVTEYLNFDFGKYKIPQKFFKFDDPNQAFLYLQSIEAAGISFFSKEGETFLVGFYGYTNFARFDYALYHNNKWTFFHLEKESKEMAFLQNFMTIHNGFLYYLVPAEAVINMPDSLVKLTVNIETRERLKSGDNYVVAKIKLK